jgi:hypothetical protein
VIKVLVSLRVPGVDLHEVVQAHRRHVIEAMQRLTRVKAQTPEDDVVLAVVVDAQIFRLEAVVRWLDAADTRLAAHPRRTLRTPPAPGDAAPPAAAPTEQAHELETNP